MSSQLIDVVKRGGARPTESFQAEKLVQSILAACNSVQAPDGEAATAARSVHTAVLVWCDDKSEITSSDIRRIAAHHLKKIHPEAAYIYKHHRLVL
ncbi:TPA: hypothetical protein DIV49_04100 [Candidatus Saccharibacteria bacterium]|nr:hypothetical protein [Candidatus Saccharibacteria bacterium]HRJ90591.1 hypothetical protein [Candidatus Saccharibacteria bacterium]